MSEAEQYARDLLKKGNEKESGRLMKLAAQRFLNDLNRKDIYFNEVEANRMINFGERYCNLWEGEWEGQPMKFHPWMKFIYQQIYGWFRTEDDLRRTSKVYIQVGKKNAKSSLTAIDNLYHLYADKRVKTPKVFTAANNEEQAKICVNMSGRIVQASPALNKLVAQGVVKLSTYGETITKVIHNGRHGFIKALSKETSDKKSKTAGGKHGIFATRGAVDEYAMSPDHGNAGTISSSMAAASEPLMIYFTTAGFNMDGPCYQELRKIGMEVLEGHVEDDGFLVFIFEMDENDNWKDPENWLKCNPNLGISVKKKFLEAQVREAERLGGTTEVEVKTLNFNMWCESSEVWCPKETWDQNTHGVKLDELQNAYEGFAGIDIISGLSLNALVLLFPNIRPDIHALLPFFWMPEGKVLPENNDMRFDFSKFVDAGYIITTPGNAIENELIFRRIVAELKKYRVHSGAFLNLLENHDILQGLMKSMTWNPISKGYQGQSTPTKAWEELLVNHRIEHFNNPVLSWMNSNCMVLRKDSEIMLQRSGGRIAGISASINALAQYLTIEATRDPQDAVISSWK